MIDLKQVGTFVPLLRFKIEHGERGSDLIGVFFAALLFYGVRRMHNFVIKKFDSKSGIRKQAQKIRISL